MCLMLQWTEDMDKDVVNDYLNAVKDSINEALTNTAKVAQMAVDLEYATWPLAVIQSAIPRITLIRIFYI